LHRFYIPDVIIDVQKDETALTGGGLCKLNAVLLTHSLKPHGFNP
jgi:hypothetical protein